MRVGIFGGTFDPIHFGHLLLAETCREELGLGSVYLVPAGSPPHKMGSEITSGRQRLEMLELAIAGNPGLKAVDWELRRSGQSYTVETLRAIHQEHPDWELFLLLGGDSVVDFSTWWEPQEIAKLARLVAVNRGSESIPPQPGYGALIEVRIPAVDFSSREIRKRVRAGKSIRYWTPRAVEQYLLEHRLYEPIDRDRAPEDQPEA